MTRKILHLPVADWPAADRAAFTAAFAPGDIFDDGGGPGAHLADGTRRHMEMAYRRWLGFLLTHFPDAIRLRPPERITVENVRGFIEYLDITNRRTSILAVVDKLQMAARLIAPDRDWAWLKRVVRRLEAHAVPMDRFEHLVAPRQTLDLGFELMDTTKNLDRTDHCARELQYRNGLIIALLSLWPIRRRSVAALTVSRHVEIDPDGINLLLYPEDTKSQRPEIYRVADELVPYLRHYLDDIRPKLMQNRRHDGLWASYRGRPLSDGQIYNQVCKILRAGFGKAMNLQDFRRSAATSIAIDAPEKVGLIPGVLQHTSPDIGDKHYNLARSATASARHNAVIGEMRKALR